MTSVTSLGTSPRSWASPAGKVPGIFLQQEPRSRWKSNCSRSLQTAAHKLACFQQEHDSNGLHMSFPGALKTQTILSFTTHAAQDGVCMHNAKSCMFMHVHVESSTWRRQHHQSEGTSMFIDHVSTRFMLTCALQIPERCILRMVHGMYNASYTQKSRGLPSFDPVDPQLRHFCKN